MTTHDTDAVPSGAEQPAGDARATSRGASVAFPDVPGASRFVPAGPGWGRFWAAAADALAGWLRADGSGAAVAPVAIVVPGGTLVAPLQRALRSHLGRTGRAWAPPPIRPLAQWADELVPAVPVDALARTLGVMQAVDEAMPERLPSRAPADRLAFAGGLLAVLDAFAQAGAAGRLDDPACIARWVDAFGSPVAEPRLREDLAMLARLAQAVAPEGTDPVARDIERMRALAAAWARRGARVAWLAWQPPDRLDAVLLAELVRALPADRLLCVEPDWAAIGEGAPLLRAAWPERFEGPQRPLRERRQHWRLAPGGPRPLVLHTADREREAQLGAEWVHGRLQAAAAAGAPPPRLAIVALDRWLARRARALLERAGVLIDDREGWLLSTTVAASAAMGWLDAVGGDGYHDDLLGWLDSRFVRPPGHRELRAWIERQATRHRYLRGWAGLRGAAGDVAPDGVADLIALAAQQHREQPLRAHLERLEQAMRWAGAPRRLSADAAGRQLLGLLDALRRSAAAGHAAPVSFAEFRALLAMILERHRFYGAIDSPVEMLTPTDAAGRDFDAVLVLGAAQGVLPAPPPPLPLVNEPLRAMLGLPTAGTQAARQQRDLALLLSLAAESAITCRTDPADGTRPSPWVERLESIAGDAPLQARVDLPGGLRRLTARPGARPAVPLAVLPARLSVGGIERLVACPFRFLAQDGWGLREAPQAVDVPGVRERGELVHEILERFHVEAGERGIAVDDPQPGPARALLREVTDAVAARESAAGGGTLGEIAEWRATLEAYLVWAREDAAAGWRWQAGERDGGVQIRWSDAHGPRGLRIEGRLDRLDAGPQGLRVVDYKLGSPERLRRIADAPGRAAQLALYAWIASAEGPVAASGYLSLRRNRVEWIPLAQPAHEVLEDWAQALPRHLARIDRGEPLAAWGSECGYCASRGLCRKGHWS